MLRSEILGIGFDNISLKDAAARAYSMLREPRKHYIVTPNAEITYNCLKNHAARLAVNDADMVVPDGIGVVLASKLLGRPVKERVAGIDLASELMKLLAAGGFSLFLLGAQPGVADKAAERLTKIYPNLIIAGTHHGYFGSDSAPVIDLINRSHSDVVFVGFGSPGQEIWIHEHIGLIDARLMIGLGGSIDCFAGTVRRAPLFMRNLGLEWLFRILSQPKRLKRALKLPLFIIEVIKEFWRERFPHHP